MKILHCPECDSDGVSVESSREMRVSRVSCGDCGHELQESVNEERIVGKWNRHVKKRRLELNRLEKVSVNIRFKSASGFSSHVVFKDEGNFAALDAIRELARILAVDGFGEHALCEVKDAIERFARPRETK